MWRMLVSAGLLVTGAMSAASAADYYYEHEHYLSGPRIRASCAVNATALVLGCPPQIVPPPEIAFDLEHRYLELSAADLHRPYVQTYSWTR